MTVNRVMKENGGAAASPAVLVLAGFVPNPNTGWAGAAYSALAAQVYRFAFEATLREFAVQRLRRPSDVNLN